MGADKLKKKKLIILLIAFFVLVSGCSFQAQKVTIQKRTGVENVFEDYREITQRKHVKKAIEIVKNANWEKDKAEMKGFPDYQFQFPFKNDKNTKIASYSLWISQNGENLEIVTDSDRYVKLAKQDSADLYEILVGDTLEK